MGNSQQDKNRTVLNEMRQDRQAWMDVGHFLTMPLPTPYLQGNQSFREHISAAMKIAQLLKVK